MATASGAQETPCAVADAASAAASAAVPERDYKHLFVNAAQSASYAEFRPSYEQHCPQAFDAILAYARAAPGTYQQHEAAERVNSTNASGSGVSSGGSGFEANVAVDIATGSGQAVKALAPLFKRVIGLDVSPSQIQNAPSISNAEFKVGDAHDTGLPDACADLVTVAQALHWFDRPRFYKEAARILKPGGVLAALTYDAGVLLHRDAPVPPQPSTPESGYRLPNPDLDPVSHKLNEIWLDVYRGEGGLGPYWTSPRILVDRQYVDLEPLEPLFSDVTRVQLDMPIHTSVDALAGYVRSWSAYVDYKKKHPDPEVDPVDRQLKPRLRQVLQAAGLDPDAGALTLVQTMTVVLGRKV